MRFGKRLIAEAQPAFEGSYISYKAMKKLLKRSEEKIAAMPLHMDCSKIRRDAVQRIHDTLKSDSARAYSSLTSYINEHKDKSLRARREELLLAAEQFVALNTEGAEKITKKMFKKLEILAMPLELTFPDVHTCLLEQKLIVARAKGTSTDSSPTSGRDGDHLAAAAVRLDGALEITIQQPEAPPNRARVTDAAIAQPATPPSGAAAAFSFAASAPRRCACSCSASGLLLLIAASAALWATVVAQRNSPVPMVWLLVLLVGIGFASATSLAPTECQFRRILMLSSIFMSISALAIFTIAAFAALLSTLQYDTWCSESDDGPAPNPAVCRVIQISFFARAALSLATMPFFARSIYFSRRETHPELGLQPFQ